MKYWGNRLDSRTYLTPEIGGASMNFLAMEKQMVSATRWDQLLNTDGEFNLCAKKKLELGSN